MASDRHNIVLTGFMGTGKTVVGRRIAEVSGRTFVDLDLEIVAKHGEIAKIFERDGEERFREIERETVARIAPNRNLVIATGGGTMLDPDNVVAFLGADIFTLSADADKIFERVQADGIDGRPLLDTDDPKAEVERLLSERAETYEKFTSIDTTDMSVDEVVSAIGAAGGDVEPPAVQNIAGRVTENNEDPREAILRLLIAAIAVILIIIVAFVLAF